MRRVVTGFDEDGNAVFKYDGETKRKVKIDGIPEIVWLDEIWASNEISTIPIDDNDVTVSMDSFLPTVPGSVRFRTFTIPPSKTISGYIRKGHNVEDFYKEYKRKAPGFEFDPKQPGRHTTDTIDYGYIISGKMYLVLDKGEKRLLETGDCFIQTGTPHTWVNSFKEPCVGLVLMVGAKRK
ncbi:MAG: cupin domain-containing protein [Candidatus Hermodarchaeota archaeon]